MLYRSKIVLDVILVTLRVLDGSGVILELVSSNIRRYLKAREDTVKSIVQVDGRIDIVYLQVAPKSLQGFNQYKISFAALFLNVGVSL